MNQKRSFSSMDVIALPLLKFILLVLEFFSYAIIAYVIISWLTAFGVLNHYSKVVQIFNTTLSRLIEPLLTPLRNFLPNLGGLDLSPIFLLFVIYALELLVQRLAIKFLG